MARLAGTLAATLVAGCAVAGNGPDGANDGTADAADDAASDVDTDTGETTDLVADAEPDSSDVTDLSDGAEADAESDLTDEIEAEADADSFDEADADSFDEAAAEADAPAPYRHTILVDGVNDFRADAERFATTTTDHWAFVTWDATYVYVAYQSVDVGLLDRNRWVQVYVDADPGAGTGATTGVRYNTQAPAFPAGFGAEYHVRWSGRRGGDYLDIQSYDAGTWTSFSSGELGAQRLGTFVELRIPIADLGSPAEVGIVTFMLNETAMAEAVWAGLYPGSFTDGYHADIPIGAYLEADFASSENPNSPVNRRP